MPFHRDRAYILAMPPAKEAQRRGLDEAFGAEAAERLWTAWHQDVLPPLFTDSEYDVRLAYGPRTALAYYRPFVQRPGQLCFVPAKNLAARWGRMVDLGLAATGKVIVAASDVPDLNPDLLQAIFRRLDDVDLVIGRKTEDRFWFLAQRTWAPQLWEYSFENGAPLPGFQAHAEGLGLSVALTEPAGEVDGPEAVQHLRARLDAERFPKTCAALAALGL